MKSLKKVLNISTKGIILRTFHHPKVFSFLTVMTMVNISP